MKKQKYYLAASVLACSAISGLAMPLANTFAEGGISGESHDVTVGEVDEAIYSVDINWGDMAFDWKYNANTEKYEFRAKVDCQSNIDGVSAWQVLKEHDNLYTDQECTTLETGTINSKGPYFQKAIASGHITVVDSTINGKIKAAASFAPTNNYNWVVGKIGNELMGVAYDMPIVPLGYDPTTDTFSYTESANGELTGAGKVKSGLLYLEINDKVERSNTVTSNDKIGTVTIAISPDTD